MARFQYRLGFVGGGNMAEAIIRAAIGKGVLRAEEMIVFDPSERRREVLRELGVRLAENNGQVVRSSEQVMLAVKPQMFGEVAEEVAANLSGEQVLISIMAGISTGKIAAVLAEKAGPGGGPAVVRIIRVMPNTPVMVGLGMSGLARGSGALEGDERLAMALFGAAGKVVMVEEELIDAITAVSGSGPAYVFYLAEAMEAAAVELGLAEHARLLVRQTILGAAALLNQSQETAAELRRKVTSPGGTTEAAIRHMEANGVSAVVVRAIEAAEKRARELGQ